MEKNKNNSSDQKKRLGLGLDAIFGKHNAGNQIEYISLTQVVIAAWQPRQQFAQEQLEELSESIKTHGVLQPVLLKKIGEQYEIIAGERRVRASIIAKKKTIPAIILDADLRSLLEITMIENLQRVDLNPIEKAEGFAFLAEKFSIGHEELAKRLNINRSVITNHLRLNKLPDAVKEKLSTGQLSFGHAKVIAGKKDVAILADEIVEQKLSVRETEKKVQGKSDKAEIQRFEEMILSIIGTKPNIVIEKKGGKLIFAFNNLEELENLISKLCAL